MLFLLFFALIAGLIPPLSPTSNAQEIARFFVDHKLRVRLGVAISLLGTCVALPFLAVIVCGCAASRANSECWRSPNCSRWSSSCLHSSFRCWQKQPRHSVPAAAARDHPGAQRRVLADLHRHSRPESDTGSSAYRGDLRRPQRPADVSALVRLLQRLVCAAVDPGFSGVVFNDGPLAWNGVFAFWIPLSALVTWMVTVAVVMLRSIRAEEAASAPPAAHPSSLGRSQAGHQGRQSVNSYESPKQPEAACRVSPTELHTQPP